MRRNTKTPRNRQTANQIGNNDQTKRNSRTTHPSNKKNRKIKIRNSTLRNCAEKGGREEKRDGEGERGRREGGV